MSEEIERTIGSIMSIPMISNFIEDQKKVHEYNLEMQQEAINLWHKAKNYPRKKKKKLRKQANKDYNFWVWVTKFHQRTFQVTAL